MKVLVTDVDSKQGLAAARALSRAGASVDGIAGSNSPSRFSRYIDEISFNGDEFDERHLGQFLTFLAASSYDVLLPITGEAVSLAAKHRAEIEKYCALPLPTRDAVELCFDKVATAAFAEKLGILCPQTWAFESADEVEAKIEEIKFPVVIKGRSELSSFKARYADNAGELRAHMEHWRQEHSNCEGEKFPCLQQRITGPGCGFFALYERGSCRQYFMHRRIREVPATGGASACAESIQEDDLREAGTRLLDGLAWHGVAMVEFKRDGRTGQLYLIEINPKFWGSLELSSFCGVNFAHADALLALGNPLPPVVKYETGRRFQWLFPEDIKHLRGAWGSALAILFDFLNPRVGSNIWLRDPLPTLGYVWNSLMRVLGSKNAR